MIIMPKQRNRKKNKQHPRDPDKIQQTMYCSSEDVWGAEGKSYDYD